MTNCVKQTCMASIGLFALAVGIAAAIWFSGTSEANASSESLTESSRTPFEQRIDVIAMSCAACHGTDGRLRTAIPALAGRPAPVLHAQLSGFQNDQIPGATVMPRIARGFTDDELKALAAYFAALKP